MEEDEDDRTDHDESPLFFFVLLSFLYFRGRRSVGRWEEEEEEDSEVLSSFLFPRIFLAQVERGMSNGSIHHGGNSGGGTILLPPWLGIHQTTFHV